MIHTSKFINKNFRIKVSGIDNEGNRINKLVGVSGLLNLIGETLADKFVTRAWKAGSETTSPCGTRRERRSHKRKAFVRPTVSQIRCFVGRNSRSAGRKTTVHFQRKGKRVRIYLVYPMLFQCNKRKADELPPAQKKRYR